MSGLGIGGNHHREAAIATGLTLQRRLQVVQAGVDQALAIDGDLTGRRYQHLDLLQVAVLHRLTGGGLRQVELELGFPGEGGGDHEEDQQQEHHVDQRRQVDPHLLPPGASKIHAQFPWAVLAARRMTGAVATSLPFGSASRLPCTTSTSLVASCSMATTSSSTRRTKKRWKNRAGMATVRPAAVVISALEMPPASTAVLPVPWTITAVNTSIMPMTVPSRPSRGVIAATVPRVLR